VIDLHSHILPGVDDGARTLEESFEIARAAVEDGVEVLAATPHVRADYPTRAETMERLVATTQDALREARLPLRLCSGGEIALDFLAGLDAEERRRFGLGGNPRYLLLEFPYGGWPLSLETVVFELQAQGVTAVIAHPERNAAVQAAPERLRAAVEAGALVQLTAGSLTAGPRASALGTARALLDLGLAHLIAGDAHAPAMRRAGMREAAAAVGDDALAGWLTEGVPRAIVENEPLPERPQRRRGRLRLRRH
jgi:protein-tyrosine phosphatase